MHSISYLALGVLAFASVSTSCSLLSGDPEPGSEYPVSSLDKRYFLNRVFQTDEKGFDRWLNGQVFFCFDSSASSANREFLTEALPRVWNTLWKEGNPGIAHLTVLPGNDPDADPPRALCDNPSGHTRSIVNVIINTNKKVSTGPGGRTLNLDLSYMASSSFPYSLEAGLAHELGHVFGMEHEHQRLDFWDVEHRGSLPNGEQTTTFTCSNLADYKSQVDRVGQDFVDNTLCKDISEAIGAGFSAADWLPIQEGTGVGDEPQSFFTSTDIDFDSLMMYPGRTGGRKSRNPLDKKRKIVVSNPNDPSTPLNDGRVPTKASAGDVTGLAAMYPCQQGTQRRWMRKRNEAPVCGITPTAVPSAAATVSFSILPGFSQSIPEIVGTGVSPPFTISAFVTGVVASASASATASVAGVSSFAASATP